jgi:acyl-CoA reductase-like NAD-dependent aldehyde dehydrogenase
MALETFENYVGGVPDTSGTEYELRSPVDGRLFGKAFMASESTTLRAIDSAAAALKKWSATTIRGRQRILQKLVNIVREKSDRYAMLESLNTGKTLRQSTFMDVNISIEHASYFATTKEFRGSRKITHPEFPGTEGIVQYRPMGVVAGIAPWNVPLMMAVWKIVPALLAGNTVILKPSHYTPATAVELMRDMNTAGIPPGVVNIVTGEGSVVGRTLSKSDKVRVLSFTGSTSTGKRITLDAGGTLKRIVMELGGKSPNIVLDDADIDRAARGSIFGIFLNSGQLCESGSRLLVQSSVRQRLLDRIVYYMERMKAGNPLDMETDIGAITNSEQLSRIREMYGNALSGGASEYYRRNIDDFVPAGGLYASPAILTGVEPDMAVANEEIFGPVLAVMKFESDHEAIEIANSTRYGLAAAVWSKDVSRARRLAEEIDSGTVWINDYHLPSAAAPRGGFKDSGIGRELGLDGILEYTQTRHIFVGSDENPMSDIAYSLVVPPAE